MKESSKLVVNGAKEHIKNKYKINVEDILFHGNYVDDNGFLTLVIFMHILID